MQRLGEVLSKTYSQPVTVTATTETEFKKTVTATVTVKPSEVLTVLEDNNDVINTTFNGWYAKVIHKIGRQRFCQLASIARQDGKNPSRYFSYLLKQEYGL